MRISTARAMVSALCLLATSSLADAQYPHTPGAIPRPAATQPSPFAAAPSPYAVSPSPYAASTYPNSAPVGPNGSMVNYQPQSSVLLGTSLVGDPPVGTGHVEFTGPSSIQTGPIQSYEVDKGSSFGYGDGGTSWSIAPGVMSGSVGGCAMGGCGGCGRLGCSIGNNWFGEMGGLIMTRDRGNHYFFSYDTGNEVDQRTNTRDAAMGWGGGFEARFGRYFNCHQHAIEAVYWGLFPGRETTRTTSQDGLVGNLNGILNWDSLTYNGAGVDTIVNVAPANDGVHELHREFEFHNVELNLIKFCGACGGMGCNCSRLKLNWIAGVRFFKFSEELLFAADGDDLFITQADDEIFHYIDIDNNLIGFQLGADANYCVNNALSLDMGLRMGVYGNHITHQNEIGGNLGVATINNGPNLGREYWVENTKNDVALLGELNLGASYRFGSCWTATVGYRGVAATGVALPSNQIYLDLRGIQDVEWVDSNGSLILHGGYASLEYNF